MKTKVLLFIVFIAISFAGTAREIIDTTKVNPVKPFVIVLDAGHGGHDPGKKVGAVNEKDIALNIVKLIGSRLELNPAFKVIYTRKTDIFIELSERGAIANRAKADFFVSVHCNAASATSAAGNETWILGDGGSSKNLEVVRRENAVILLEENYQERYVGFDPNDPSAFAGALLATEEYLETSIELAKRVQENFIRDLGRKNRGVKQANFAVLRLSYMPSVLIETGFLTNAEERDFLNSTTGQQKVANAIYDAIIDYHANRDINSFIVEDVKIEAPAIENDIKKNTNPEIKQTVANNASRLYKVQLAASSTKLEAIPANFKNLPKISRVQVGAIFKYFTGAETTEWGARQLLIKAKESGYPEAFVVSEVNGVVTKL